MNVSSFVVLAGCFIIEASKHMTWHAQDGKLVLEGDEGALFRDSIFMMSNAIPPPPMTKAHLSMQPQCPTR